MIAVTEYHVNSSPLVSAQALLALGKEAYQSDGFDSAYGLVYTMFDGLHTSEITRILTGDIKAHATKKGFLVFLEDYDYG